MAVPPGLIIVAIPLLPDSEEPMASVMTRFGKWRKNSSLTDGEKSAAGRGDADQRRQVVGSRGSSSSASMSGLPMASPVIMTMLTFTPRPDATPRGGRTWARGRSGCRRSSGP